MWRFPAQALTEHRNPDTLKKLNDAERAKKEKEQQEYFSLELGEQEREKGKRGSVSHCFPPSCVQGYGKQSHAFLIAGIVLRP